MIFYLGTHLPSWLAQTDVPLFVSDTTLRTLNRLPRAKGIWAADSGGFSEIAAHGRWTISAKDYVARVRRYRDEIGGLQWAAIQDWMCEPDMIKKTGLSVDEHQKRTIDSLIELRTLAPDISWLPVIQGWENWSYDRHVDEYESRGIDLRKEPIVGIGSVCRRQNTVGAACTVMRLHSYGLKIHGFGFKLQGVKSTANHLASSDSLAWSFGARKSPPLPGHDLPGPNGERGHKNCANCMEYALIWREQVLTMIEIKERELRQAIEHEALHKPDHAVQLKLSV